MILSRFRVEMGNGNRSWITFDDFLDCRIRSALESGFGTRDSSFGISSQNRRLILAYSVVAFKPSPIILLSNFYSSIKLCDRKILLVKYYKKTYSL